MFVLMFLTLFSLYFSCIYGRAHLYKYGCYSPPRLEESERELLSICSIPPHLACHAIPLALVQYYPDRIDCAFGLHILNRRALLNLHKTGQA